LKYESDGGPGLPELAAVLRGSERAEEALTLEGRRDRGSCEVGGNL
jgi:hypothetical protein